MVRWAPAVVLLSALFTTASRGPNAPSGAVPGASAPRVVSIAITGRTTLNFPGDSSQLTAIATISDGTSRDVTADAAWLERIDPGRYLVRGTDGRAQNAQSSRVPRYFCPVVLRRTGVAGASFTH